MTTIQLGQIWEETVSTNETRRFEVKNVLLDEVQVLDKDQPHLSVYPHGRTLRASSILSSPTKYKLVS
jgi:hypothetical protein